MGPTVAVATCPDARGVDEDMPHLLAALGDTGIAAAARDWSDRDVDWSSFDLVVVRSTWDYAPRRDEFVAWAEHVAAVGRIANPAPVLRWNTDKRYLDDLEADGVPVVPTTFLAPGELPAGGTAASASIVGSIPVGSGFVVKPTISAGSKDTFRHAARSEDPDSVVTALEHVEAIHRSGRTAMVQPYLPAVDIDGETGLVFFDGVFSHAFRKGPLLRAGDAAVPGLFAPEDIQRRDATDEQLAVATGVLDAARSRTGLDLLYARVDLLAGADGRSVLLELELTEPSFFLAMDPAAPGRIAAAVAAAVR